MPIELLVMATLVEDTRLALPTDGSKPEIDRVNIDEVVAI